MHGGQPGLRLAERGEQRAHPLEPEPVARPRRERLEPGDVRHALYAGRARLELAPVALELRPLAVDHVGRRVRDEPLVREHPFGPRDLLREAGPLGLDVAGCLAPLGPDDGGEDPALLVRAELDLHPAAAEDLRRLLHAVERAGRVGVRGVRLRPRRDDQPRAAGRQVRPDLLRDVRHQRVEEREQPLERGERGGAAVLVAVVQARLDRLGVPVAEVVEGEVVERAGRGGEVEARPRLLDRRRAPTSSRARIHRSSSDAGARAPASTPSVCWRISRATFQSLFASLRPSSIAPTA